MREWRAGRWPRRPRGAASGGLGRMPDLLAVDRAVGRGPAVPLGWRLASDRRGEQEVEPAHLGALTELPGAVVPAGQSLALEPAADGGGVLAGDGEGCPVGAGAAGAAEEHGAVSDAADPDAVAAGLGVGLDEDGAVGKNTGVVPAFNGADFGGESIGRLPCRGVDTPARDGAGDSGNRCFSHVLIVPSNASSPQPKPQASGPAIGGLPRVGPAFRGPVAAPPAVTGRRPAPGPVTERLRRRSRAIIHAMRFGILGPTQVRRSDGREVTVGGPRLRALLALLLVDAGSVVAAERLIDGLYGGAPPNDATNALQSQVSRLRH